jgi:FMN phosphatase YigB (HAD superfamily)
MHISFDLDDTLIPGSRPFETERQTYLQRFFGIEKIRFGTINLFKGLRRQGHNVHIYTTSYRPVSKIRWMFFLYGIPVSKIVNQEIHDRHV